MSKTNAGELILLQAGLGEAVTPFDNADAYLGVGNGTTAFDVAQTDLQGGSKFRKAMDATFPTRTGLVATFQATYGSAEANFHWQEWGVFNASSSGVMLNRKVEDLGTKSAGQTWRLTAVLTFAPA